MASDAADDGLHTALARTAREYDALPYLSKPFAESHPGRLAAIARLMGLEAPAVETARVLELGCASGGNIIPVAAHLPGARCTGVDLGKRQIEAGQERITRLGLSNIALHHASITDLADDFGTFDYIIAHGVYSWVSEPVREAVLRVCGRNLAPGGVAYISFNVLPGWRTYQPVRDAIRAMIPGTLPEADRVRAAQQMLELIAHFTINDDDYGSALRKYAGNLLERPADLLFHDYIEPVNEPFMAADFFTAAHRHGLGYLGESDMRAMFADNFGEAFAHEVNERTGRQVYPYEQLFDILSGRSFRQTLLIKAERQGGIERPVRPERLEGLHLFIPRGTAIECQADSAAVSSAQGFGMQVHGRALVSALGRLLAASPAAVSCEQCLAGLPGPERMAAARLLCRLVTSGLLLASAVAMPAAQAGAMPQATALARRDAADAAGWSTNARHESVGLEPVLQLLLPHLDGTNDHAALAAILARAAAAGEIAIETGDALPADADALHAMLLVAVPDLLEALAELGLLEQGGANLRHA